MVLSSRCEVPGDLKGLWGSVKKSSVGHALFGPRPCFSLGREGKENVLSAFSFWLALLLGVGGQKIGSQISLPGSRAERKDFGSHPEEESFAVMARWRMHDGTN